MAKQARNLGSEINPFRPVFHWENISFQINYFRFLFVTNCNSNQQKSTVPGLVTCRGSQNGRCGTHNGQTAESIMTLLSLTLRYESSTLILYKELSSPIFQSLSVSQ